MSHRETHFCAIKRPLSRSLDSWKRSFSVGGRECLNGGGSCQHHSDLYLGKAKRLDLRRNQAFHNASGGDKRDRTADVLNVIKRSPSYRGYIPPQTGQKQRFNTRDYLLWRGLLCIDEIIVDTFRRIDYYLFCYCTYQRNLFCKLLIVFKWLIS